MPFRDLDTLETIQASLFSQITTASNLGWKGSVRVIFKNIRNLYIEKDCFTRCREPNTSMIFINVHRSAFAIPVHPLI